jgi:hypothetical protein
MSLAGQGGEISWVLMPIACWTLWATGRLERHGDQLVPRHFLIHGLE